MKKSFKQFFKSENRYDKRSVRIGLAVCSIILFLWSFTLIYPFVWALINTFKTPMQFVDNSFNLPPDAWRFDNWEKAFTKLLVPLPDGTKAGLLEMIFNSFWYTFIGALLSMLPCVMFSYVVAKYPFKFCKFLYMFSVIIMMIPIYGSMPANVKVFNDWGLTDSPMFLIGSMGCIGGSTWLIMTSFMESLPWTYAEAVFIDGGGHWTVFLKIMLPMCMPILTALYVMGCIARWNDYMTPYMYLPSFPTLATGIFRLDSTGYGKANRPVYFASIIISVIPIIAVFILCQDQIMNNVTIGGIKG